MGNNLIRELFKFKQEGGKLIYGSNYERPISISMPVDYGTVYDFNEVSINEWDNIETTYLLMRIDELEYKIDQLKSNVYNSRL